MISDNSFQELLRALRDRPEWRDELRRALLSDELLMVPERLTRIEAALERLAEAQARTDERLAALTARVDQLAEAQARTAEQVSALTARMERVEEQISALTARMERVEEQISALTTRIDQMAGAIVLLTGRVERLGREVGRLSEGVGARAELDAQQALERLFAQKGYRVLDRLRPVAMNGEVDVAGRVRDAAGQTLSVLLEAKFRLQRGDVTGWARRLRDRAVLSRLRLEGLPPPLLAYAFGLRVYGKAEEAGRELGIGILDTNGEIVAPAPLGAGSS